MEETNNKIVRGFHGFAMEWNGDTGIVDVKYKGESLRGVVHVSVIGFDQKLADLGIPVLKLEILADV